MEESEFLRTTPFFVDILITSDQEILVWAYGVHDWSKDFISALKAFGVLVEVNFCSPCG